MHDTFNRISINFRLPALGSSTEPLAPSTKQTRMPVTHNNPDHKPENNLQDRRGTPVHSGELETDVGEPRYILWGPHMDYQGPMFFYREQLQANP